MIYAHSLRSGLTLLSLLLGLSGAAAQTTAPAAVSPPSLFSRTGVINSVDAASGAIVINDVRYRLSEAVRVYTYDPALRDQAAQRAETRLKNPSALREGLRVGYNVTGEGGGQRGTLTEAWLLPAGKSLESQSGENRSERGKGNSPGASQEGGSPQAEPRTRSTR